MIAGLALAAVLTVSGGPPPTDQPASYYAAGCQSVRVGPAFEARGWCDVEVVPGVWVAPHEVDAVRAYLDAAARLTARWAPIAACESGGRWNLDSRYDGGLQFDPRTWIGAGGTEFAPHAFEATPLEQMTVAERVLAAQGPRAWPVCSRRAGWR